MSLGMSRFMSATIRLVTSLQKRSISRPLYPFVMFESVS